VWLAAPARLGTVTPPDPESSDTAAALERTILALLDQRAATSTICPSDAARAVGTSEGWRDLMQAARDAASRLVEAGAVEITQGGEVVDLATARGPIRIRRGQRFGST
jgi:hypothetical protein